MKVLGGLVVVIGIGLAGYLRYLRVNYWVFALVLFVVFLVLGDVMISQGGYTRKQNTPIGRVDDVHGQLDRTGRPRRTLRVGRGRPLRAVIRPVVASDLGPHSAPGSPSSNYCAATRCWGRAVPTVCAFEGPVAAGLSQ
jgi:hypothetical protein